MHHTDETIAALATPPGEGALAVLRLSGPGARDALLALAPPATALRPRYLHHLALVAPSGAALDEVLAAWMPAPHSYTGEDVVEIYTHGGPVTVRALLDALFALGLRAAEPGEFTYRAFLSGRLDLIQAEAVGELIGSRSDAARRLALEQLGGSLSRRLAPLSRRLLELQRDLEAAIDFADEDIEFVDRATVAATVEALRDDMATLLGGAEGGRLLREGVSVALVGAPNVGKSSLFNALLGEERAIVTEEPGTTRDLLQESWVRGGVVFHLQDTAGQREAEGAAERLGVERGRDAAARAGLALRVCDGTRVPESEERAAIAALDPGRELLLVNKADLAACDPAPYAALAPAGTVVLVLSARCGTGLEALQAQLLALATGGRATDALQLDFALNRRQAARLRAAHDVLAALDANTLATLETELLARALREALAALDELSGRELSESVLAEIFSTFCVGK